MTAARSHVLAPVIRGTLIDDRKSDEAENEALAKPTPEVPLSTSSIKLCYGNNGEDAVGSGQEES